MTPGTLADWVKVQEIERDIVLLYDQLMDHHSIMGNLHYGDVFAIMYWDYLDPTGLDWTQGAFLRQGCLVMLLAMATDQLEGSGGYLERHRDAIDRALGSCVAHSDECARLLAHVRATVAAASEPPSSQSESLASESTWVRTALVRGYFVAKAERRTEGATCS